MSGFALTLLSSPVMYQPTDTNWFLSSGGLVIMGEGGQIAIDNTLDTRLELLKESALPAARLALFGENNNRKFFD